MHCCSCSMRATALLPSLAVEGGQATGSCPGHEHTQQPQLLHAAAATCALLRNHPATRASPPPHPPTTTTTTPAPPPPPASPLARRRQATIVPRGHALGMVSQVPEKDEYSITRQQLLAQIDVCMGGKAAEELIFGGCWGRGGAVCWEKRQHGCCRGLVLLRGAVCSLGEEAAGRCGCWVPSPLLGAWPAAAAVSRGARGARLQPLPPAFTHILPHTNTPPLCGCPDAGEDHVTSGATSDLRQATRLARHMVVDCGMSDKIGPGARRHWAAVGVAGRRGCLQFRSAWRGRRCIAH